MKMKGLKYFLMLMVALAIYSGCKKDETDAAGGSPAVSDPLIYRIWLQDTATVIFYDSSINAMDTVGITFTDITGTPIHLLEQYAPANQFFTFNGALTDTGLHTTFSLNATHLTINVPDTQFVFNDREIVALTDTSLIWKWTIPNSNPPYITTLYFSEY